MSDLKRRVQLINSVRTELHEAGVSDYLRAYARGDYDSLEEAMEACGELVLVTEEDFREAAE